METFSELVEYVEENLGGEAINPGRRKEVVLVIHNSDFDEDAVYEALPNWGGEHAQSEDLEDWEEIENSVIVSTGLCVDSDGESLIPFEQEDDYANDEDEDEDDWEDDSNSGWLNDDEI